MGLRAWSLGPVVLAASSALGAEAQAEPMFHVRVESGRPGTVLQRLSGTSWSEVDPTWRTYPTGPFNATHTFGANYVFEDVFSPVCVAPCTATVPSSSVYRIAGEGIVESHRFRIPMDGARLDISAGSRERAPGATCSSSPGSGRRSPVERWP